MIPTAWTISFNGPPTGIVQHMAMSDFACPNSLTVSFVPETFPPLSQMILNECFTEIFLSFID